ncbi:MAG: hypothetical protein QW842_07735 [Candidatus Nezhaarchaeales archaeon]
MSIAKTLSEVLKLEEVRVAEEKGRWTVKLAEEALSRKVHG